MAIVWETVYRDIHKLCDDATEIVDGIIGGCLSMGFDLFLTGMSAVVGVGKAKAGETGIAIVEALVSSAEGVKSDVFESGNALTPLQVANSLKKSIDELTSRAIGEEADIGGVFQGNRSYVVGHNSEYVAPAIAWGLASSDDNGSNGNEVLGDSRGPTGMSVAAVYQAGKQSLPVLAEQFGDAATSLSNAKLATGIWARSSELNGPSGCMSDFNSFVNSIVVPLNATEKNLMDTGDALVKAADSFQFTDNDQATYYKNHKDDLVI